MTSRTELTREVEYRRCQRDVLYFLNNYWSIEIVGSGYEVSGLRDYQEADVKRMLAATTGEEKDRQIRLKARQIGYTTIACGFAFWDAFFHPHHPWLAAQQSEDEAQKTLLTKVKVPYLRLPPWLRDRGPKLLTENMQEMVFDNGSSIAAVHSGAAAARGRAVYGAIMDEAAYMEDAEALFGALDPLTYGPLFMFSTANGMGNFFHEIWLDSGLADTEWESGFHPWSVVPGRSESWYNRTKRRYRTREWLFYQEYPSTSVEAFAKSGRTVFPMDTLEEENDWAPPSVRYDITLLDTYYAEDMPVEDQLQRATIPEGEDRDLELHVWEHPYTERDDDGFLLRKPNFVVSADVAEGLEDGDYSAIVVADANTLEQVASVKAHVPIEDLGALVEWLGYWYYTALVGVERNNQGLVPLQYLTLRSYPRLYRMDTIATQKRRDRTPRYGWFALDVRERVWTPDGPAKMGDLRVGDSVLGSDGRATTVLGVYPQGERPAWKVTFRDGAEVVCDKDHLWLTQHSGTAKPRVRPLKDVEIGQWVPRLSAPAQHCAAVPLPVDPYLLGALLGDGGMSHRAVTFTTAEGAMLDLIRPLLPPEVKIQLQEPMKYRLAVPGGTRGGNPLTAALHGLGLMQLHGRDKFVPDPYMNASAGDRLALLQGLMDTDGHAKVGGGCLFSSASKRLAEDVRLLVLSLGGFATVYRREPSPPRGKSVMWVTSVSLPTPPFRLARKRFHERKLMPRRKIVAIEDAGIREMVCIRVAAEDGLFLVSDYVLTHNTNRSTKPKMVIDFLKAIRGNLFALHDTRFLQEARTFIADGSGGYSASSSNHDDILIATLICYQLCLDVGRYPIVWQDDRPRPPTFDEVFGAMETYHGKIGSSPLYQPLGQKKRPPAYQRSFILYPANVHTVDIGDR